MVESVSNVFPVYVYPHHQLHDPPDSPEVPGRVTELLRAVADSGLSPVEPLDLGQAPIAAVHSEGLLALLPTAYQQFAKLKEGPRPAIPDSFAVRELAGHIPRSIWGQLGHYCSDNLTPISKYTWEVAYWSAQAALSAAKAIDGGARLAYGLCRPPGHHAYRDMYGGYCYLNNAAIAAEWLAARGRRVAILDIDYHHGNGTQGIFYERSDIFVCSLHADPEDEYPYFCGFAHERGAGAGEGYTLNIPLPLETDEVPYLAALGRGLAAINSFAPDVVVLSLGFDTLRADPHGGFCLAPDSFHRIGRLVAELRRPILLVQEGGYLLSGLRPALAAFIDGLHAI